MTIDVDLHIKPQTKQTNLLNQVANLYWTLFVV